MNVFTVIKTIGFYAEQRPADSWAELYAGLGAVRTATGAEGRRTAWESAAGALTRALADVFSAASPELAAHGVDVLIYPHGGPVVAMLYAGDACARVSFDHPSLEETVLAAVLDLTRGGSPDRTLKDLMRFYMERIDPAALGEEWGGTRNVRQLGEVWEAVWAAVAPELVPLGVTATPVPGYTEALVAAGDFEVPAVWLEGPRGRVEMYCYGLVPEAVTDAARDLSSAIRAIR